MSVATERNPASGSPNGKGSESFFSGLGARLRSLSKDLPSKASPSSPTREDDAHSVTSTVIDKNERSTSRGREAFHSSGRGGLGNIRQASASRDRPTDGPDDFSITRGREAAPSPSRQVYSTGRGGAGNIRSPSRDPQPNTNSEYEAQVIKKHNESEAGAIHSSGRGGLGNISRSRSRDPTRQAPSPVRHSTGRGGAGNMFAGETPSNIAEEQERRGLRETEGVHSTGRGGFANLTSTPTPAVEHHKHTEGEYESSGRGGAGNIHI